MAHRPRRAAKARVISSRLWYRATEAMCPYSEEEPSTAAGMRRASDSAAPSWK